MLPELLLALEQAILQQQAALQPCTMGFLVLGAAQALEDLSHQSRRRDPDLLGTSTRAVSKNEMHK